MSEQRSVCVGKISGLFGVKGWVKVFSYTNPRENILNYSPWQLIKGNESKEIHPVDGKRHGETVIARFDQINSREDAAGLCGWDININYSQLPETEENEFYWADLIGLRVETIDGVPLGVVDHLLETGANDVLVLAGDRERLIPFLQGQTIMDIDLDKGIMIVDWDPEF